MRRQKKSRAKRGTLSLVRTLRNWHKKDRSNHWLTPRALLEALAQCGFDFELDTASSEEANRVHRFPRIFTVKDNGLSRSWKVKTDNSVFCNPPYDDCMAWVLKAENEFNEHGQSIVLLLPSKTETKYFQQAMKGASHVCFINKRQVFNEDFADGPASFASALVIYGGDKVPKLEHLETLGELVETASCRKKKSA